MGSQVNTIIGIELCYFGSKTNYFLKKLKCIVLFYFNQSLM